MDLFQKCHIDLLDKVRELDVYPYFHCLESKQAPIVFMEGKRKIMLGSNNYLGFTENEKVIEAGIKALEKYGSGVSGSRFLNGTLDLHLELEHALAAYTGYEEAITCSTGFQTNLSIISAICGKNDYILNDRENHASIYDACRLTYATVLRYKHSDMEDLEKKLQSIPEIAGKLIVTDGVFSMRGDICRLPEICALAEKYGARVMVDDAHGFGVLGQGGRGTANYFGLTDKVDITMLTFSKSLASIGGCMLTSHRVADYVRHVSRPFIFSASMTPCSAATALAALNELEKDQERPVRLMNIAKYFQKELIASGIKIIEAPTPIVPIFTYKTLDTLYYGKRLFDEGVYVNPVVAPACVEGECLLRTTLMATHTETIIDEAVNIISQELKKPSPFE
ncbi:MAG: aminotransferase class I/II-fold pyridoxal phosphate-dependent enzyme [Paludibacteraceae bacterium]|nr:aminotransferase class I/II-fold pyridoxal phosphate-dependent enzyme [Candidatus Colicola coprequi]MCQ2334182.1 aminotransferase class I/II-fold pyridoxal phosphate-dependent enzyme [Paludibacteraceae bacterium]